MKYAVFLILTLTSLLFAHADTGEVKVTETESLLWLREQLQLTAPIYKAVHEKVLRYRMDAQFPQAQAVQDSILLELTKVTPSVVRIADLQKRVAVQAQLQSEQFVEHLTEIKKILSDDQFAAFISVSGNVYQDLPFELPRYTNEHVHVDGVIHAHGAEKSAKILTTPPNTHSHDSGATHSHGIEPVAGFNRESAHPDLDAVTHAAPPRKSKRYRH